jgi:hypothetical protein
MDYSIWSVLEAGVCAKPHKSLESLTLSQINSETPTPVTAAATLGNRVVSSWLQVWSTIA